MLWKSRRNPQLVHSWQHMVHVPMLLGSTWCSERGIKKRIRPFLCCFTIRTMSSSQSSIGIQCLAHHFGWLHLWDKRETTASLIWENEIYIYTYLGGLLQREQFIFIGNCCKSDGWNERNCSTCFLKANRLNNSWMTFSCLYGKYVAGRLA